MDILTYSGQVSRAGYDMICNELSKQASDSLILVLNTPGGDPHAGFRIARALHHHYGSFDVLLPGACKSAGTLICIGASQLWLDDQSELGPLDIQVKKKDEIVGQNSGLDILQAVNYLQNQAMAAFRTYLIELTTQAALSTRVASDIASKLTTGLFSPIFGQIDPMRLAEIQRATDIAFAYGSRLNEKSQNLRQQGLERLVVSYPSHGFVIDRKEAGTIFTKVSKPEGLLQHLSRFFYASIAKNYTDETPTVTFLTLPDPRMQHQLPNQPDGEQNADVPDPTPGTRSDGGSDGENSANGEQAAQLRAGALSLIASHQFGAQDG
ncbi:SDH family Clp fold serine proteinase [Burkholderia gladioli]|uniref:SDH family Clp fold serine proteinase n=1 Tax=Burkholderia gladioli TaxID=28095 RepID=UPI00164210C0|nr:SppA protein [Burkholderia gladioli]